VGQSPETDPFLAMMDSHRGRAFVRVMRVLPSAPRCACCRAPFGGVGGRIVRPLGLGPSRKNPQLCALCFEKAPMGGYDMEIGVLFADIRGFTSMAERSEPGAMAELLNRFYATATQILCRHAIIDKLVGDEVMALYLPMLFDDDVAQHMVTDARELLQAAGYGAADEPWVKLGVGLDYGRAFVGNVGSGAVKDFTAIGDVVNTASRLQGAAAGGEIVISSRVHALAGDHAPGATPRELELKGKTEPERAMVIEMSNAAAPAP
jgi:adenylate cyclase